MDEPMNLHGLLLKRRNSVSNRHQEGVALITTLMILLLLSTMVVNADGEPGKLVRWQLRSGCDSHQWPHDDSRSSDQCSRR
jgi:hypothetical protein